MSFAARSVYVFSSTKHDYTSNNSGSKCSFQNNKIPVLARVLRGKPNGCIYFTIRCRTQIPMDNRTASVLNTAVT